MTAPTWASATEVKPAPGALLLVQSFVNTADFDLGTDLLADTASDSAQRWLTAAGLQGAAVTATAAELHLARDVREELRRLLLANAGAPLPATDELPALQAVITDASIRLALDPDGSIDLTADPRRRLPEGLLSLLMIIRDAQHDGTWARLKACGNDECRWVFYDRSHSRQGTWCDMAACGNVIKNRNLRARRGSSARRAATGA
jgi:predicted RNA-binding Zn ribbon-like protein